MMHENELKKIPTMVGAKIELTMVRARSKIKIAIRHESTHGFN